MKKIIISLSSIFAIAFLALPILFEAGSVKFSSTYAQTKDQCGAQLDKAEEEYQAGKWTKLFS